MTFLSVIPNIMPTTIITAQAGTGAGCIKKWWKLTMISGNVNQSESRILYLITI